MPNEAKAEQRRQRAKEGEGGGEMTIDHDAAMHDGGRHSALHIKQINCIYKYVTSNVSYIMLLSLLTEIILLPFAAYPVPLPFPFSI